MALPDFKSSLANLGSAGCVIVMSPSGRAS